jgi:hypothetical protein
VGGIFIIESTGDSEGNHVKFWSEDPKVMSQDNIHNFSRYLVMILHLYFATNSARL